MDADAGQPDAEWPMPVADFLAGDYLARADVLLTRRHWDITSKLIRWATKSHFSHAAMIFLVPHQEHGFDNTFLIEATGSGVNLQNLASYLEDPRLVVGVRRLEHDWFDKGPQSMVRGRMLNAINATYSYAQIMTIGRDVFRQLAFGLRHRISGRRKAMVRWNWQPPNEFICSGLVQLGFVQSIGQLVREGQLPPHALADVMFEPDMASLLEGTDWNEFTNAEQLGIIWDFVSDFGRELEAATPEDLAKTPRLEWKYIIRNREVHRVYSSVDAEDLLNWSPDWGEPAQAP